MSALLERTRGYTPAQQDWLVGLGLFVSAVILFFWRLDYPSTIVFDEVHYVGAARNLVTLTKHINTEHPIFAKEMIALGILIFGDNAIGWRFFGALLMAMTVPAIFGLCRLFDLPKWGALLAATLLLFDQTLYVMARTAMLDPYAIGFFALFMVTLAWTARPQRSLGWLFVGVVVSAIFLALAASSKWMAGINGVLVWIGVIIWRIVGGDKDKFWVDRLLGKGPGFARLNLPLVILIHGVIALAVYLATFIPLTMLKENPLKGFGGILEAQMTIYKRSALPLAKHPYQSLWWEWPLMFKPIWYYFQREGGQETTPVHAIFYVGNPLVYWGGFLASFACVSWGIARKSKLLLTVAAAFFAFWLIWMVIPKKIGFLYYYASASLMLGPMIAAVIETVAPEKWRVGARLLTGALAILLFIWFFPILAALAVPGETWRGWVFFRWWY